MTDKQTVLVNGKKYEVAGNSGEFVINDKILSPDVRQLGPDHWHILLGGKSYDVFRSEGRDGVEFTVNGTPYTVEMQDRMALLLQQMGMASGAAAKAADAKAPMPGLVLRIETSPGSEVKKGEPLLVLEAMKMENVIKAATDGTVKSIEVTKDQAVEKGQVLVKFS